MAAGDYDGEGIWIYGEDDPASPFSTTLNLLAESTSTAVSDVRGRVSALEMGWGEFTGSNVFTPDGSVTVLDATASVLPGVMASVWMRLGQVDVPAGQVIVVVGTVSTALRPRTNFGPVHGWCGDGFVSGLVSASTGELSIRWTSGGVNGATILSGTWPA